MLTDLNHLTLAVCELDRSVAFYTALLGQRLEARWDGGAYLSLGGRTNQSEGDSFYFLDPDGHQLEIHVGDLASRLAACRAKPYAGMRFVTGPAD